MWQCDNCGYTDDEGVTFDEEKSEENPAETVRYCPECGSDEVFLVEDMDEDDEDDDEFFADDGKDYAEDEDALWGDAEQPKGNGNADQEKW